MKKLFILSILIMFLGTMSVSASDKTQDKTITKPDGTTGTIPGIKVPTYG